MEQEGTTGSESIAELLQALIWMEEHVELRRHCEDNCRGAEEEERRECEDNCCHKEEERCRCEEDSHRAEEEGMRRREGGNIIGGTKKSKGEKGPIRREENKDVYWRLCW